LTNGDAVAVIFSHGSVRGAINPLAYWWRADRRQQPRQQASTELERSAPIQPCTGGKKKRLARNESAKKRGEKARARALERERERESELAPRRDEEEDRGSDRGSRGRRRRRRRKRK